MKTFQIESFQLIESKKWMPAGILSWDDNNGSGIQEVEFPPKFCFGTKEEADNFFRNYYSKVKFVEVRG